MSDTVAEIQREANERTKQAQASVTAFAENENIRIADDPRSGDGLSISWHEESGDEFDAITSAARYHDVVVVAGGPDRRGRLPEEALGGIILGSGQPVLLAPQTATKEPFRNIAIAWKDTAEAARAVTAAMPLLEASNRVEVFTINESDHDSARTLQSLDSIVHYLRAHDLDANGHFLISEGRAPADAVLENARKRNVSLLIGRRLRTQPHS